jgi:alkanesulfonate monooxygenase SsuD/methylene tetrahydromethanopterin reductase-like flavin-dependent oxidoreductase (luciferase family)
MRYAIMIEPQQGMAYSDILAIALTAEEAGFEAIFRSDHYSSFPGEPGLRTTDAWSTLAGLARETSRIRIGSLVSPMTFRVPGSFAKVVQTVDEMSGGRVEVGLGAGWNVPEHEQHGIPYPADKVRVDLLEETLQLFHGLWDQPDGWTMDGEHVKVKGSLFRPKNRRPHLIVGGTGKPRSVRLAASYADEHNLSSATPAQAVEVNAKLDAQCTSLGRDPRTLVRSAMTGVLLGRTQAELDRRIADQLAVWGEQSEDAATWLDARRDRWVMGLPELARERVAALEAAGIERVMLQAFLPFDLDQVKLAGEIFLG